MTAITRGSGPPLLLLHGVGGNASAWSRQLDAFSTKFHTIAWDAPGYGGSAPFSTERPKVRDYARAVLALMDALAIERANLLGHSMGGLIAAYVAAEAGNRIGRLVLADCSSGHRGYDSVKREQILKARVGSKARENPEAYARERVAHLLSPAADSALREEAIRVLSEIRHPGFQHAAAMVSDSDLFAVSPDIRLPTMVLCGSADTVTPPELNQRIADSIPGAMYRLLSGCGHWSFLENPDAFNAAVLDFLI